MDSLTLSTSGVLVSIYFCLLKHNPDLYIHSLKQAQTKLKCAVNVEEFLKSRWRETILRYVGTQTSPQ